MKKSVYIVLFMVLFPSIGHAQNSVKTKLIIPVKSSGLNLHQTENLEAVSFSLKLNIMVESENSYRSLFSDLPLLKLREFNFKKNIFLTSEFSLNDMLENTVNSVNANLLNTYDDHIAELFKEAPSPVKLKCIIRL